MGVGAAIAVEPSTKYPGRWLVHLDHADIVQYHTVAEKWFDTWDRIPEKHVQGDGNDLWSILLRGAAGELAVCRFYGVEPVWTFGKADVGADIRLRGGMIDVKTVGWRWRHRPLLTVKDGKGQQADAYVLAVANTGDGIVELVGLVPKRVFDQNARQTDWGGGHPCKSLFDKALIRPLTRPVRRSA